MDVDTIVDTDVDTIVDNCNELQAILSDFVVSKTKNKYRKINVLT